MKTKVTIEMFFDDDCTPHDFDKEKLEEFRAALYSLLPHFSNSLCLANQPEMAVLRVEKVDFIP